MLRHLKQLSSTLKTKSAVDEKAEQTARMRHRPRRGLERLPPLVSWALKRVERLLQEWFTPYLEERGLRHLFGHLPNLLGIPSQPPGIVERDFSPHQEHR